VLDGLERVVQPIDEELYTGLQQQALQRIAVRDADDWPVLACAMTLGCLLLRLKAGVYRLRRVTFLNRLARDKPP
jgi:predicted nucleic acid-binding protein